MHCKLLSGGEVYTLYMGNVRFNSHPQKWKDVAIIFRIFIFSCILFCFVWILVNKNLIKACHYDNILLLHMLYLYTRLLNFKRRENILVYRDRVMKMAAGKQSELVKFGTFQNPTMTIQVATHWCWKVSMIKDFRVRTGRINDNAPSLPHVVITRATSLEPAFIYYLSPSSLNI